MKIEKLEWKNIFSYGNKVIEVDFENDGQLWQLSGKSGAGKSSFLSIPKLLFFGKTESCDGKPIKIGDVANRINKHGWIRGTVKNGNDTYIIERTFSPQSLTVYKNGENLDRAGLKNMQDIIDKEILEGLPYNIFSNVMTLSLNSFKSFISMSPADKRGIIDKIFSLEIINKVYELVKKDMRDLGNAINVSNSQIYSLEQTIKTSTAELESLKTKTTEDCSEKLNTLKERIQKVADLYKSQYDEYMVHYNKYSDFATAKNTILQSKNGLLIEKRHIEEKIHLFNMDKCPTCGTSFSGGDFDDVKTSLNKSLEEKNKEIAELDTKYNDVVSSESSALSMLNEFKSNLDKISKKQNELTIEYRTIENSITSSGEYQSIQKIIDETEKSKTIIEASIKESSEKMQYLGIMEEMYSADGIKKKMMENYIPTLNKEIDETLTVLGFPYTLTFDTNFNPHLQHLGVDIEPQSLSMGEHKKVDLTVLCSILRMLKHKYPQINLVCLDETLSSLDYESSTDIVKYLKDIANNMGLNIFIVSHTMLDENLFDKHLHAEKISGFTELNYI